MTGPADAEHGVESTGWLDLDADQDDLTHYMQATARMRERAEQAEAEVTTHRQQIENLTRLIGYWHETADALNAELERLRQREAALREPLDRLWLGIGPWAVKGDGVLEPWTVYTLDASHAPVGFLPFGYGLPGKWGLEDQARALAALLNGARTALVQAEQP